METSSPAPVNILTDVTALERRDFARHLVARQVYASDAVKTLVVRYRITDTEAMRMYHTARGELAAASAAKEPQDLIREAIDFWRGVISDPEQPLSVKMTAQREITQLTTERNSPAEPSAEWVGADVASRRAAWSSRTSASVNSLASRFWRPPGVASVAFRPSHALSTNSFRTKRGSHSIGTPAF